MNLIKIKSIQEQFSAARAIKVKSNQIKIKIKSKNRLKSYQIKIKSNQGTLDGPSAGFACLNLKLSNIQSSINSLNVFINEVVVTRTFKDFDQVNGIDIRLREYFQLVVLCRLGFSLRIGPADVFSTSVNAKAVRFRVSGRHQFVLGLALHGWVRI